MTGNAVSGHVYTARNADEIATEIVTALNELKKSGYLVTFLENQDIEGELVITFALGDAQQTIKIESYEWKKTGSVTDIVTDKLNI